MTLDLTDLHRCILYYPTISIPTGTWLRQSLLYWDEIGSIVPRSYQGKALIHYSPDIQYLKNEGQFKPFATDIVLQYNKLSELESEFNTILSSPSFNSHLPIRSKWKLTSKIHEDKISHGLFYALERKGLAKQFPKNNEWYLFEENTALLYMTVLAKHIAENDTNWTVTGTDFPAYENLLLQNMNKDEGVACLATNYCNVLPIPRKDIPLTDIIEFKYRRRDELLNFRLVLDEFQSELKKCERQSDIRQVAVQFKEKSERSLSNLKSALDDSSIATIAGSIKTLIKLDSPALWASLVVTIGEAAKVTDIPLTWKIAGAAILGTVEIFTYLTDKKNEKRATLRSEPFTYLAYAEAEGII